MDKSTLQHLRIPFSLYLLPVYAFAASQDPISDLSTLIISFIAIHLFLYPAANGYNSYFDKDTGSIGGLENPLPVKRELYYTSLIFDLISIVIGFLISWQFAVMLFIYGLESKAYSHPIIRLKKYAFLSSFVTSIFQGGFTYLMSILALHHLTFNQLYDKAIIIPSILCSLSFLAFYPMTQIYQHNDDTQKGEKTISIILGLRGTFLFSAIIFLFANIGYYFYFLAIFNSTAVFIIFQLFLFPLMIYFISWFTLVYKDKINANFRYTMLFNKIATLCIVTFFIAISIIQKMF